MDHHSVDSCMVKNVIRFASRSFHLPLLSISQHFQKMHWTFPCVGHKSFTFSKKPCITLLHTKIRLLGVFWLLMFVVVVLFLVVFFFFQILAITRDPSIFCLFELIALNTHQPIESFFSVLHNCFFNWGEPVFLTHRLNLFDFFLTLPYED